MMDECQVSLTGYVATQPEIKTFDSGASHVSMRVAWTERRRDRITGEWVDGTTSYATVICWRNLGTNVALSLRTGDAVLVKGKLQVRTYEDKEGVRRTKVEVDVLSIGHDLNRGVSRFMRVRPKTGMTAAEFAAAKAAGQLPQSAANGAAAGTASAGSGAGLRFSGGLESAAGDGSPALADSPVTDEPQDWAREHDDADLSGEAPRAADGEGEDGAEVGSEAGSEADGGADAEADAEDAMAPAVL